MPDFGTLVRLLQEAYTYLFGAQVPTLLVQVAFAVLTLLAALFLLNWTLQLVGYGLLWAGSRLLRAPRQLPVAT